MAQKDNYVVVHIFTGKNRIRTHFIESIDLSLHALSINTHIDMHLKNPGLTQAPFTCGAMWKRSPTVDNFVLVIFFQ